MSGRDAWRWTDERGVQRLVSTAELREALASGVIPASTLVWRQGMEAWAPAATLAEFAEATHSKRGGAVTQQPRREPTGAPRAAPEESVDSLEIELLEEPVAPSTARSSGLAGLRPAAAPSASMREARAPAPGRPKRESMRTLTGIEAPSGPPPSSAGAPIVVPAAGGAFDAGVARAITQLPRYGGAQAAEDSATVIPRAPKVPTTGGPHEGTASATPRPIGRSGHPPPRPVGRDAPALPGAAPKGSTDNGRTASAGTADVSSHAGEPSVGKAGPPVWWTSNRGAAGSTRPAGRTVPPPPMPVRMPTIPPRRPAGPRAASTAPPSAGAGAQPPARAPGATPTASPKLVAAPAPEAPADAQALRGAGTGAAEASSAPPHAAPDAIAPTRTPDRAALPDEASRSSERLANDEVAARVGVQPTKGQAPPAALSTATAAPPAQPRGQDNGDRAAPLASDSAMTTAEARPPSRSSPSDEAARPSASSQPSQAANEPRVHASPLLAQDAHAASTSAGGDAAQPSQAGTAPAWQPKRPLSDSPLPELRRSGDRLAGSTVEVPVSSLLGAGGGLITLVVAAFFAGRCSVGGTRAVSLETARSALGAAQGVARSAAPPPPKPCWVARQPRRWSALASKSIPFEVAPTSRGAFLVGYARSATEAVVLEVNPTTGEGAELLSRKESAEIVSVTPGEGGVLSVVTADEKALRSIVNVPGPTPFVVGLGASAVVAADRLDAAPVKLWPLQGEEPLEAPRAVLAGGQGYALAFRREKAVWTGWIGPDRKPLGELTTVLGSGGVVGKPSLGWNGRNLAIVFADRPTSSSPWEIRAGQAAAGGVPTSTQVIPLPSGGPGGDAFAPDIAGLEDGRWILVWTEGPPRSRAMRAQTLAPDFSPLGDPIALSPPAGNFGQGILGVAPKSGYVSVVFLSKPAASYELWGVILQCG